MKTLEIIDGSTTQVIADDIITLIKSGNGLLVDAVGEDAINKTCSGVDLAERILKLDQLFLNVKAVLPQQNTQNDVTKTSLAFEITSEPFFTKIDLTNPRIEVAV